MLLTALFVSTALTQTPHIEESAVVDPSTYQVEVLAEGLDHPWNISWLPSGDMLVTERSGALRIIRDNELLASAVSGTPAVHSRSQAGLFEVELHPDFENNNLLYFTYAAGTAKKNTLTLGRGRFVETPDGGTIEDFEVLFEANADRDTSAHYGGRMAWLPDGTLLLTSGEGYKYMKKAQSLDNHFGKVLRLTADGEPAPGNPFADRDGALPEIWSYGHRNPQGIVVATDGTVYESEHGPKGGDELNVIEPGINYGWPAITYGIDYSGAQISPFKELKGMAQPEFHWTPSIAPSALLYYTGDLFPELNGKLLSGSLVFNSVRISDPSSPEAAQSEMLNERGMRVRDVAQGPDGAIYVATEIRRENTGGEILRILPEQ